MPRPGWIHTYIIMLGISIPLATKTLYLIWDIWVYCGPFIHSSDVFCNAGTFKVEKKSREREYFPMFSQLIVCNCKTWGVGLY